MNGTIDGIIESSILRRKDARPKMIDLFDFIYEILEQAKLIYRDKKQISVYLGLRMFRELTKIFEPIKILYTLIKVVLT